MPFGALCVVCSRLFFLLLFLLLLLVAPPSNAFTVVGTPPRVLMTRCVITTTTTRSTSTRLDATWSDSKAVKDYQEFLNSGRQEVERASDQASVILHDGTERTAALAACLFETGLGDDVLLTPNQALPDALQGQTEYPIYITLPPYALTEFLTNLGDSYKERNDNFCFFSGGFMGNIEDVLKERGYCRDSMTQIMVAGLHITPTGRPQDVSVNLGLDSYGEPKLANQCTATGKWAGAVAERFERSQVTCAVDFYREWRRKMWERSFYDAVFPLLGAVRDQQPTTHANVAQYYEDEVSDMVWDLSQLLRGWRAVTLLYGFEERLLGTAEIRGAETPCQPLPDAAMYPYIWGMNVFQESQMVVDYLWYAQTEKGFLQGVQLPPQRADEDYTSHMRKGNLRADGVI